MSTTAKLTLEVIEIAVDLRECSFHRKNLTVFESLQISVLIQKNILFAQANVLDYSATTPVALEKIAMELNNVADGLNNIANKE